MTLYSNRIRNAIEITANKEAVTKCFLSLSSKISIHERPGQILTVSTENLNIMICDDKAAD